MRSESPAMILTVFHSESKADIAAHDVSESLRRIITTAKSESKL